MTRKDMEQYIEKTYGCTAEYPWFKYPTNAVFRHQCNRKWFALIMDIPKAKLGQESEGDIAVMNLKCDYLLICSLLEKDGFYPAYHMNKMHWITVALDGSADDDTIKWLLDMSYDATRKKK